MADMGDPIGYLESTAESWRAGARKLRNDAALLHARADELETRANELDGMARDLHNWMPDEAKRALGYEVAAE